MRVEDVPIEQACTRDLDRMPASANGVERYCDSCCKSVHDLSAMGPERARAFLAANRGACISYVVDRRGNLVFAASLVASLAACTPHGEQKDDRRRTSGPELRIVEAAKKEERAEELKRIAAAELMKRLEPELDRKLGEWQSSPAAVEQQREALLREQAKLQAEQDARDRRAK